MNYYGEVPGETYNRLSEGSYLIPIQEMDFKVKWKQQGRYIVVLDNECLNIALGNTAPWQSSPSVRVQVKSEYIWSEGIIDAHQQVLSVIADLFMDTPHREQVSRADFFADILWSKPFLPGDMAKFCTRARNKVTRNDGPRVCGFIIGEGGIIMARIYDKTLELRKSGKTWLYELWGVDENEQVWRVEFQLRREALKEFSLETFDDLLNASQGLWDYCTGKWLYARKAGKKKTRLVSFWEKVQAAKFAPGDDSVPLIKREKMRSGMTEKQAADQIGGIVESYARSQEIGLNSTAFNQLIPRVRERWISSRESTSQN